MPAMQFTPEQEALLATLAPVRTVAELQTILARLAPVVPRWVPEIMQPSQPADDTRIELLSLYLEVDAHKDRLAGANHGPDAVARFVDAIVAWRTLEAMLSTGLSLGSYRTRTAEEVVAASLAWRDKLRRAASVVFFLEPIRRARYQDHNASGTVEEEISDLRSLVAAATDDVAVLAQAGFGPEDLATGEHLLAEADGRDVLAVLGIRSQSDIKIKRDIYLTLAVTLGRYARACADVAFFADSATNERFRRVSFAKALRRIRPIRPSRDAAPPIDDDEPADPADMPAVTTTLAPMTTETPRADA